MTAERKVTTRPTETRLPDLRGQIALAADRDQYLGILLGLAVALALGFEDVMGDLVDVGADLLQNVSAQRSITASTKFHQHHFAGDTRHA